MIMWQVRCALFVCLVRSSLTSSKSLEPTDVDRLNQALLRMDENDYGSYLLFAVPAASAGKNLFQMPDGLGEDCVRTAHVLMRSFAKPTTAFRSLYVVYLSQAKAGRGRFNGHFQKQVNRTCDYMNEEAKKWPLDFPNFDELKKNVQLPHPVDDYIYAIPSDQDVDIWLRTVAVNMEDPEMIKYEAVLNFHTQKKSKANGLDVMATAQAVDRLAQSPTYGPIVDQLFLEALEDYTADLLPQKIDKYAATHSPAFARKVDQYFLKHPLLQQKYKKIKQQSIYEEQNANTTY